MRKGIISVIFCIIAVFSLAVTANAALTESEKSWLNSTHYGYGLLNTNEKLAYEAIYEGVEKEQKIIPFEVSWGIKKDQFDKVYQYYLHDSPEHYWLWGDGLSFRFDSEFQGDYVKTITLTYNGSKASMALDFEKGVTSLIGDLMENKSLSDKEKALIVHDRLADWVEYDSSVNYSNGKQYIHRAYGAITRHLAVCDGYAYAYQLLLNRLGIMAVTVSGYGSSSNYSEVTKTWSKNDVGSHAWNLVELSEGKWSYVDVTWDDRTQDLGIIHCYFGNGNEIIAGESPLNTDFNFETNKGKLKNDLELYGGRDHYIVHQELNSMGKSVISIPFELPSNIVTNGWFNSENENLPGYKYTVEKKKDSTVFHFLYPGNDLENVHNIGYAWVNTNITKILGIANLGTNNSVFYNQFGRELIVTLKTASDHVHSGGTATCHSRAVCSICHQAYGNYANHKITEYCPFEAPSTITAENKHEGTREHWICSECGSTFIERKYNGETVYDEVRFEDLVVEPYTPGDVNGDGNVNNRDVIALFRFLSGEEVYGISLGACNPNGDEGFNNKDITHLFKYVSKVSGIKLN